MTLVEIQKQLDWMKSEMVNDPNAVEITWNFGKLTISGNRNRAGKVVWSFRKHADGFISIYSFKGLAQFIHANNK